MDGLTWALLAAAVVALVVLVLAVRKSRRAGVERARHEAAQLRESALDSEWEARERAAHAAQAEAEARRVRAEADERAARAESAEVQAQRLARERDEANAAHEQRLREADRLDPDVPTDRDGNRLTPDGSGHDDQADHAGHRPAVPDARGPSYDERHRAHWQDGRPDAAPEEPADTAPDARQWIEQRHPRRPEDRES